MDWAKNIENFESLSIDNKDEYKKAIKEAYSVHLYSNWYAVKYMLLRYIKE